MSSWGHLFHRANETAKARTEQVMNEHTDPKLQLEMAVRALQEHHNHLTEAAAHVLADEKTAKMRLSDLHAKAERLEGSARAAKSASDAAAAKGDERGAETNLSAARGLAAQLAQVRDEIADKEKLVPQLEDAANQARTAVQESADMLQSKLNERQRILSQIDQASMTEEMSQAVKQLSDITGSSDVPSFADIQQRVQDRYAVAQSSVDLHANDPAMLDMQAHHAEITAQADSILAELSGPPAAKPLEAAPS